MPSKRVVVGRKAKRAAVFLLLIVVATVISVPFFSVAMKDVTLIEGEFQRPLAKTEWTTPELISQRLMVPPRLSQPHQTVNEMRKGTGRRDVASIRRNTTLVAELLPLKSGGPSTLSHPSTPRPYFIIHAGPDKTGTTSIQSFLVKNAELLERDGYDASFSKASVNKNHRKSANFLLNCFIFPKYVHRPCHLGKEQEQTLESVRAFYTQASQPHILWSTEGFRWAQLGRNPDWPWFLKQIQEQFHVHVLVVYRRYFDWLSSRYNEDHRSSEYSGIAFLRWPDDPTGGGGGVDIRPFEDYWKNEKNGTCPQNNARALKDCGSFFANRVRVLDDGTKVPVHPLLEMMRPLRMSSSSKNVRIQVLNMHGELDVVEAFFCDGVPLTKTKDETGREVLASQACLEARRHAALTRLAKQQQEQPALQFEADADGAMVVVGRDKATKRKERYQQHTSRQSDMAKIQYDVIAVEAHRLGILNWNVSRSTARYQVELYLQENDDGELPWICPSQEVLQSLESTSFQFEQELLQLDMGRHLTFRETHADAFAKALEQKKFCSVNATHVLREEKIRAFLASLPPDTAREDWVHRRGRKKTKKQKQA